MTLNMTWVDTLCCISRVREISPLKYAAFLKFLSGSDTLWTPPSPLQLGGVHSWDRSTCLLYYHPSPPSTRGKVQNNQKYVHMCIPKQFKDSRGLLYNPDRVRSAIPRRSRSCSLYLAIWTDLEVSSRSPYILPETRTRTRTTRTFPLNR